MTGAELKAVRATLKCSTRDLAVAIGVEQEVILSWEREETFPTKKDVVAIEALARRGADTIPKAARKGASPMAILKDPALWSVVRKLIAHPDFRRRVQTLADDYDDPT